MRIRECRLALGMTQEEMVDGEESEFGLEIMQMVRLLQGIENKHLRKAAMEQVKVLVGVKL